MRELRNYGLAAVCASVLVAAGCGSDSDQPAPAVEPDPTPPPAVEPDPEPEPTPMGMIEGIDPTTGLLAALAAAAQMGDEDMEFTIQPGMSHTVGGVKFMCAAGEMMCEVDLMVNAMGGVDGEWEGGTVTAMFIDPAGNMNSANAMSIAGIMSNALGASPRAEMPAMPGIRHYHFIDNGGTPTTTTNRYEPHGHDEAGMAHVGYDHYHDVQGNAMAPMDAVTALPRGAYRRQLATPATPATLNLRVGDMGLGSIDDSEVSVTHMLDPNVVNNGNSTVTAAVDMAGMTDDIGSEMAGAIALEGWHHKVLHADWGDTSMPGRDGGYETLAVVYSDIGPSTSVPFWSVAARLATNPDAQPDPMWFTPDNPAGRQVVTINPDAANGAWDTAASAVAIEVQGPQSAIFNMPGIQQGTSFSGTYFGAPGTFTCMSQCTLRRSATQDEDFTIPDLNGAAPGHSGVDTSGAEVLVGMWDFRPAANAMVEVPDQDWLAFGFWLTAPNNPAGTHRLGVFFDGMDSYAYSNAVLRTPDGTQLIGSASYAGAATGVYVDGTDTGIFTADAALTANFDGNGNASHTVSGRIDNFRDSMGYYLGGDTRKHPNDPMAGGENDWLVLLDSSANDSGVKTRNIQYGRNNNDGRVSGVTGGAADGVGWTGEWSGWLYGPGHSAAVAATPTGIAGDFRAITGDMSKGVVGAFGARCATGC